jgi:hypothetical protein
MPHWKPWFSTGFVYAGPSVDCILLGWNYQNNIQGFGGSAGFVKIPILVGQICMI